MDVGADDTNLRWADIASQRVRDRRGRRQGAGRRHSRQHDHAVDVRDNAIGVEGAHALVDAMRHSPTMRAINVGQSLRAISMFSKPLTNEARRLLARQACGLVMNARGQTIEVVLQ